MDVWPAVVMVGILLKVGVHSNGWSPWHSPERNRCSLLLQKEGTVRATQLTAEAHLIMLQVRIAGGVETWEGVAAQNSLPPQLMGCNCVWAHCACFLYWGSEIEVSVGYLCMEASWDRTQRILRKVVFKKLPYMPFQHGDHHQSSSGREQGDLAPCCGFDNLTCSLPGRVFSTGVIRCDWLSNLCCKEVGRAGGSQELHTYVLFPINIFLLWGSSYLCQLYLLPQHFSCIRNVEIIWRGVMLGSGIYQDLLIPTMSLPHHTPICFPFWTLPEKFHRHLSYVWVTPAQCFSNIAPILYISSFT